MADYISRDYTVENMENYPWDTEHDKNAAIHLVRELVPAADVRPVVRGKWTRVDYELCGHDYICSECGCKSDGPWKFCHGCGAEMRERENAEEEA